MLSLAPTLATTPRHRAHIRPHGRSGRDELAGDDDDAVYNTCTARCKWRIKALL